MPHPMREYQQTVNPKTGRTEVIFVNLEKVYPEPDTECSFEELRARHHGWLDMDWRAIRKEERKEVSKAIQVHIDAEPLPKVAPSTFAAPTKEVLKTRTVPLKGSIEDELVLNDENTPPSLVDSQTAKTTKKARREERANRTRKIRVMDVKEIRGETQTSESSVHAHGLGSDGLLI